MTTTSYFTKDDASVSPRTWHLFDHATSAALCDSGLKVAGSVDDVTDVVPSSDTVHLECREALAVIEQPQAEAEAAAYAEANPEPEAETVDETDAPADGEQAPDETPADGEPVADGEEEVAPQ